VLKPKTISGFASPSMSRRSVFSLVTVGSTRWRVQRRDSPCGFTYSTIGRDSEASTSGQPSPVKSAACVTMFSTYVSLGLTVRPR
jgi:hypothetical protein